ncbi:RcpC/CpaB family pilus assembly protein [Novipirellula artificiosorum]|uniref:SAF domain protein n=1 Tax=Novipirellula artificiosorum TaxID=2528016 RepID=A0A5C6D309_9BACT|nr:hypothetical protein [Novipirellula artificiosorum]TWU31128.1 hypothetical protein Poly41_63190 [Novipirellula artificiosorum]
MRKQKSSFGLFKIVLALLLVFVVLGVGLIASLWASGVPMERLAFWRVEESRPDSISLPMNWQTIQAYSKVTRNDLLDPRTGSIAGVEIPLTALGGMSATIVDGDGALVDKRVEAAQQTNDGIVLQLEDGTIVTDRQLVKLGGAFTQATDIIGRVVKSDKSSGFAFAELNFFERGTPAGLAGATPPGMRAMTLEAAQLAGVHRISMGEQIDLVANIPLQKLSRFEFSTGSQLPSADLVVDSGRSSRDQENETTARLVARQAIVLTPVVKRVSTETSASLSQGKRLLSVPVEEVVLAVAAEDVSAVTSALELGATVNVLVRSGRPESDESSTDVPDGRVAVPIPGQTLLAYQTIRPTSFEDPATAYVRTIQVPMETASQSSWITELSDLVGRIPRHDLPATVPIQEGDLMPVGTMAGLSGATPPGRVLFFLDTEGLIGGDAFEFGQHLDLVASRTEDEPRGGNRGGFANVTLTDAQRTRVEPIADDVIVVMPTRSPGNPTARKSKDSKDGETPKLIVAVRPDQVAQLEYAVAVGSNLRATVRSGGSPVDANEMVTDTPQRVTVMKFDPLSDAKRTDIFVGGSREAQLFGAGK